MANWFFEPGHTAAEFRARHMMVSWVRGHFKDVHGTMEFDPENPRATSVEVTIDARKIWTGEQDRERLQELLKTLEEKQKIVGLLSAYLDAKQEAVRVVIGLDQALPSMRNFVLIGAPARVGGEVMGSLAVIGPTRIDYQHAMTAVSYIARLFDKILNETE